MGETWRVERYRGSAQELHDLEPGDVPQPAVWICEPTRPAVVLGSTQRHLPLDREVIEIGGLDVARRRSGGGVVLVDPVHTVWIDLVLPRGHELWVDDVGRAMHWVGDTWVQALAALGLDAAVHRGGLDPRRWGRTVCVAGMGPGEVVDGEGRKLVGISQRRTRHLSRFQTVAALAAPAVDLGALLALAKDEAESLRADLEATTATLQLARNVVIEAVVAALPR